MTARAAGRVHSSQQDSANVNKVDVIFLDNHLLALNKPAGLVTQPSGHHADSLESRAKEWLKIKHNKPGNVFLEAVHRIDRPVSGIVLFARTSKALSRLNAFQREKKTHKIYWAVVEGKLKRESGTLEHTLVHGSGHAQVVGKNHPRGKRAILTYRTLGSTQQFSLVEIQLETGRYHQIRCQFSAIGNPIAGDQKYGASTSLGETIALHHRELRIPHPVGSHEEQRFSSPPPATSPWTNFPDFCH